MPRGFESRRTRRPSGLPETLPSADGAVHRRGYRDWVGFHRTVGPWSECSFCGPGSGRGHKGTWAGCIVSLTTPTRPLPTNLILMVLVSWGGDEVYSSTSTSSPDHGNFGGGSSIPLHTTRWSSLIPSALDDHPWSPWSMEGPWSGPGRSMAFPSSLCCRSSVFFHVPVFPVVIRLICDSSPSGTSHFVADREVGLRPIPTVVSCRLVVGMSRRDGAGEGSRMDVLPIASHPGPCASRCWAESLPRTRRHSCSSMVGSRVGVFR